MDKAGSSPLTDSTTDDLLSPTAQRLTETFGRLDLPPTLRTMLAVMERRLRGKADNEVRASLLMLGHALIEVAGGGIPELEVPRVVAPDDEQEADVDALVGDLSTVP